MNKKLVTFGALITTITSVASASDFKYDDQKINEICRDFAAGKKLQNVIYELSKMSFSTYSNSRSDVIKNAMAVINSGTNNATCNTIVRNCGWFLQQRYQDSVLIQLNNIIAEVLSGINSSCMRHTQNEDVIKYGGESSTNYSVDVYMPKKVKTLEDLACLSQAEYNYVFMYNIIARNLISMVTSIQDGKEVTLSNLRTVNTFKKTIKNLMDPATQAKEIEQTKEDIIKYIAIQTYHYKIKNKVETLTFDPENYDYKGIGKEEIDQLLNDNGIASVYIKSAIAKANKSMHDVEQYFIVTGLADYITTQNLITAGMAKTNYCTMKHWRSNIETAKSNNEMFACIRNSVGDDEYFTIKNGDKKLIKHIERIWKDKKERPIDYQVIEPCDGKEQYRIVKNYQDHKDGTDGKAAIKPAIHEYERIDGIAIQTPMASIRYTLDTPSNIINFEEVKNQLHTNCIIATGTGEYKINDNALQQKGSGQVQLIITPMLALKYSIIYATQDMNRLEFKKESNNEEIEKLKSFTYIESTGKITSYDAVKNGNYIGRKYNPQITYKITDQQEQDKNTGVEYFQTLDNMECEETNIETEEIRLKNQGADPKFANKNLPWGSVSAYELSTVPLQCRYIYQFSFELDSEGEDTKRTPIKSDKYGASNDELVATNMNEIMKSLTKTAIVNKALNDHRVEKALIDPASVTPQFLHQQLLNYMNQCNN